MIDGNKTSLVYISVCELSLRKPVFFFCLSYLIQIDTSVNCSFWLVALEEGLHCLVTHAHIGKVQSKFLRQTWSPAAQGFNVIKAG